MALIIAKDGENARKIDKSEFRNPCVTMHKNYPLTLPS